MKTLLRSRLLAVALISILFVLPLTACSDNSLARAQEASANITVVLSTAPLLVSSISNLIPTEQVARVQSGFEEINLAVQSFNASLQSTTKLDKESKARLGANLTETVVTLLSRLQAQGVFVVSNSAASTRLAQILSVLQAITSRVATYLNARTVVAAFSPLKLESDIAALRELFEPPRPPQVLAG
ncbi:MAG: hypothetical protein MSG64_15755 [Pyrinomonadaceae bacterium MAG19_C2-C3]|nr:hypothetical protein [Pyrinomonadaceae bacterium MAG19_C2-C3]